MNNQCFLRLLIGVILTSHSLSAGLNSQNYTIRRANDGEPGYSSDRKNGGNGGNGEDGENGQDGGDGQYGNGGNGGNGGNAE